MLKVQAECMKVQAEMLKVQAKMPKVSQDTESASQMIFNTKKIIPICHLLLNFPFYELDNVLWIRHQSGDVSRSEKERSAKYRSFECLNHRRCSL
jgi:hypothetical protein